MADKISSSPFLILTLCIVSVLSLPEQGVWDVNITQPQILPFQKSMYNNTHISVQLHCTPTGASIPTLQVKWVIRRTPCAEEYLKVEVQEAPRQGFFETPTKDLYSLNYQTIDYHTSKVYDIICDGNPFDLTDESGIKPVIAAPVLSYATGNITSSSNVAAVSKVATSAGADPAQKRQKRDANNDPAQQVPGKTSTKQAEKKVEKKETKAMEKSKHDYVVYRTWTDGIYLFLFEVKNVDVDPADFVMEVNVQMKGPHGFLSAIEWPLLPFYGSMCIVYIIYGIAWLVLSACNWRDLLRIQFWIGGVIFLGMLEKAVFFGEYSSINITGRSVRGAVVFAEVVSCLKRTVARMLVVIVSLGFGIVKPRLGPMLHKVLGMGALYFILGSVEACLRALRAKSDVSSQALLANIPLAVLDAAICWWVFTSLVQTTRTLRLRRNLVKLSLYRHFTNTLIFAVLASVAFMIWSIKQHRLTTCLTDWKEIWVDDAFWHLLFSILLLVIMILWRPNNNNQRYAFSPLLDAAEEDEAEEPMISDAFEGMKMRTNSNSRSGSPKPKENKADVLSKDDKSLTEEDLKWIEENIPTSVTDTALPSLLDSDEEIMTTKFEMSKME